MCVLLTGTFCALAVGATFPAFVVMIGGVLDHLSPYFDHLAPLSSPEALTLIKETFGEYAKNALPYLVKYAM